jgi:hypothetical protein
MVDEPLAKPAPEQQVATIVTVAKDEPYPTGTPAVTNMANVHTPQERTAGPIGTNGNLWERQKIQNLAAGGMIAGGAAGT